MLWEDRGVPSLLFLSSYWETCFETMVGIGPSATVAADVGTEVVPLGKSILRNST